MSPPAGWPRIVIAGGGPTGWMAGAALATALRGAGSVRVIEGDKDGSGDELAQVEPTLPGIGDFLRFLGVAEDGVMAAAQATFRLGTRFVGWSGPGTGRFQPFGEIGSSLESVGFHHVLLRMQSLGKPQGAEDFSLAALASRARKFSRPSADPRSVLSTLAYGLHLHCGRYADWLRVHAASLGVAGSAGRITDVVLTEPDGAIAALVLEGGERVAGDLFIDCTGARARLIGQALGVGTEDWDRWSPFDRMVEMIGRPDGAPEPFTQITADASGWRRKSPIQAGVGLATISSSAFLGEDEALRKLRSAAGGPAQSDPRLTRLGFHRRSQAWSGNCIALGAAAAAVGPLLGSGLQLAQGGLARLIALFPHPQDNRAARAEYNRLAAEEAERLRDFVILHYRLNGRAGEPVWDACRDASPPDSLAHKIEVFESRARTPMLDEETFSEGDWASAFLGMGVRPRRHDPLADGMDPAWIGGVLGRMREAMGQAVQAMPTHADYLKAHCSSPVRERAT